MDSFSTFRSRLIFLFALAIFPAVALAGALSWRVYANAREAREADYRQTALAVALQERAVLAAAASIARTLLSSAADDIAGALCDGRLARVVAANPTYAAIAVFGASGRVCGGGEPASLDAFDAPSLLAPLSSPDASDPHALSVSQKDPPPQVAVSTPLGDRRNVLVVVIGAASLRQAIAGIKPEGNGAVALVDPASSLIVATGHDSRADHWLPRNAGFWKVQDAAASLLRKPSRDGREFVYAVEPVEGGALNAIAGFPAVRFGPAERQFALGLAFPLVLFAIVLAVAWIAIDRLFLRWLRRLDGTARRLAFGDLTIKAELPSAAPLELRQYAHAFDQMTGVLGARTRELATVAQQRSHLLRELHHRVKNNFQVIASFLNLMKRERSGPTREALALAESRVHAMAAAYKLALAQGDIRLVSVPVLVEDVVKYVQHAAEVRGGRIRITSEEGIAFLDLDHAIPLALLLVETLWPIVTNPAMTERVDVSMEKQDERLVLAITSPSAGGFAAGRFQRAFLHQIDAREIAPPPPDAILAVTLPLAGETAPDNVDEPRGVQAKSKSMAS